VLQLAWVFGGVVGLLIGGVWFGHNTAVYTIGFCVIAAMLAVGIVQVMLLSKGRTLVPRGRRGGGAAGPTGTRPWPVDPEPASRPRATPGSRARRPRKAGTDR